MSVMREYDTPRYKLTRVTDALAEMAKNGSEAYEYLLQAVQAGADDCDSDGDLSAIKACLNNINNEIFEATLSAAMVLSACPEWKPEEKKEDENA